MLFPFQRNVATEPRESTLKACRNETSQGTETEKNILLVFSHSLVVSLLVDQQYVERLIKCVCQK